jgi:rhodanese-related sulfurtransferase
MSGTISVTALKDLMRSGEGAVFDVRELGEAEAGHVLGAAFLPRRLIEFRIADLVPARATPIVVYDEGGPRAALAAATLTRLGYAAVSVLEGGTKAWLAAGLALIEGSNVPSKLFGEQIHDKQHTPGISARKLNELQQSGRPVLVCDIRTPGEYAVARIPNAYRTAGFDVALCMPELARRNVPVVVHCAGRTRSIIACETLRALGMNEVYALENGTMGWVLEGLKLEKTAGAGPIVPTSADRAQAHAKALRLAEVAGVVRSGAREVADWLEQRNRGEANIYAFDARQTEEFEAGHIDGTAILPGALVVQRTDELLPVRKGRVILVDDDETRALIAGHWLCRMGLPHVCVLEGGMAAWCEAGFTLTPGRGRRPPLGLESAASQVEAIASGELLALMRLDSPPLILNVDTSVQFAKAHVAGSEWIPRGWLELRIGAIAPKFSSHIVVTCRDGQQSSLAAATLRDLGYNHVQALASGLKAATGLPIEKGAHPSADETRDIILPPFAKGEAGMRRYLEWETRLTGQKHQ